MPFCFGSLSLVEFDIVISSLGLWCVFPRIRLDMPVRLYVLFVKPFFSLVR